MLLEGTIIARALEGMSYQFTALLSERLQAHPTELCIQMLENRILYAVDNYKQYVLSYPSKENEPSLDLVCKFFDFPVSFFESVLLCE